MLKAYFWLTFCVVVWGSNFVFGKILVRDFSPTILTFLRLTFIVIVLLLIRLLSNSKQRNRLNKKDISIILVLGIIGFLSINGLFLLGCKLLTRQHQR